MEGRENELELTSDTDNDNESCYLGRLNLIRKRLSDYDERRIQCASTRTARSRSPVRSGGRSRSPTNTLRSRSPRSRRRRRLWNKDYSSRSPSPCDTTRSRSRSPINSETVETPVFSPLTRSQSGSPFGSPRSMSPVKFVRSPVGTSSLLSSTEDSSEESSYGSTETSTSNYSPETQSENNTVTSELNNDSLRSRSPWMNQYEPPLLLSDCNDLNTETDGPLDISTEETALTQSALTQSALTQSALTENVNESSSTGLNQPSTNSSDSRLEQFKKCSQMLREMLKKPYIESKPGSPQPSCSGVQRRLKTISASRMDPYAYRSSRCKFDPRFQPIALPGMDLRLDSSSGLIQSSRLVRSSALGISLNLNNNVRSQDSLSSESSSSSTGARCRAFASTSTQLEQYLLQQSFYRERNQRMIEDTASAIIAAHSQPSTSSRMSPFLPSSTNSDVNPSSQPLPNVLPSEVCLEMYNKPNVIQLQHSSASHTFQHSTHPSPSDTIPSISPTVSGAVSTTSSSLELFSQLERSSLSPPPSTPSPPPTTPTPPPSTPSPPPTTPCRPPTTPTPPPSTPSPPPTTPCPPPTNPTPPPTNPTPPPTTPTPPPTTPSPHSTHSTDAIQSTQIPEQPPLDNDNLPSNARTESPPNSILHNMIPVSIEVLETPENRIIRMYGFDLPTGTIQTGSNDNEYIQTVSNNESNNPAITQVLALCCICLDEVVEHMPVSTVCGHIFGTQCILTYLNYYGCCPLCKAPLTCADINRMFE